MIKRLTEKQFERLWSEQLSEIPLEKVLEQYASINNGRVKFETWQKAHQEKRCAAIIRANDPIMFDTAYWDHINS